MAPDPLRAMRELLAMAHACASLKDPDDVLATALPLLLSVTGTDTALTLGATRSGPDGVLHITHCAGLELDPDAGVVAQAPTTSGTLVEGPVPTAWRSSGVERVAVRRMADGDTLLVLAATSADWDPEDLALELGLATLDAHLERTSLTQAPRVDRPVDMEEFERRKALEINDNVVQGLVAASYALDQGHVDECAEYLHRTLSSARAMMDGMLEPTEGQGFEPGDLIRSTAATIGAHDPVIPASPPPPENTHTVLVVDDADDLRMLLRSRMEGRRGLTVVGEAADGLAAVELASELQPDLVMLDLAMPRMDGLEALPLIREAVPGVRVIVLSGFNQSTLAEKAMEAGADRYVIKGGSMRQLLDLVDTVLADAS